MAATVRRRARPEGWGALCQNERSCGGGGKTLLLTLALLTLVAAALAALIVADFTTAQAQSDDEATGRIVAWRLDDGRVEFGWQPRTNGGWGARVPSQRSFPTDARVNQWRNSSPVEVDEATIGRINAHRLSSGSIEFAFTPTGGQRILPPARFFPTDATIDVWLRSSEITFPVEQPTVAEMEEAILAVLFGDDSRIRANLTAGRYWIAATHYGDRGEGAYQLAVSVEY